MSKYYGSVGYSTFSETVPGVWVEGITERQYYGEVIRNSRRWQGSDNLNDNLTISNRISIVADPYAYENFNAIRYITWMGSKWKVNNIEVSYPRLIFEIGGLYNEQTTS
jgi:hypothetical protein